MDEIEFKFVVPPESLALLEMELKSARIEALVGLATQWADRHGLWLSTVSRTSPFWRS